MGFHFTWKLSHKDGEKANVGSSLGKPFVKYAADGVLKSPVGETKEVLKLSVVCSHWMSSGDWIWNQMVFGGRREEVEFREHGGQG